jgi:hypothetical protein
MANRLSGIGGGAHRHHRHILNVRISMFAWIIGDTAAGSICLKKRCLILNGTSLLGCYTATTVLPRPMRPRPADIIDGRILAATKRIVDNDFRLLENHPTSIR